MSLKSSLATSACFLLVAIGCGPPPLPAPVQPLVSTPNEAFRERRPSVSAATPPTGVEVASATLSNGMALWVVNRPELPYVALSVVSRDAGTARGFASVETIRLTTRAVVEGGTSWRNGQIVEPPMINGEQVGFGSDATHSRFELRVVKPSLDEGMGILGRTVSSPAFKNLDSVRLAELKRMQNASNDLSSVLFEVTVDAALGEHAAAKILGTNMDEVRKVAPWALERCYQELFRPETSALIAVGAVTLEELQPLAERDFGSWRAKRPRPTASSRKPFEPRWDGPHVHFVPQGGEQGVVLLLQPAPPSTAVQEDLAFLLMADIAVGPISSRSNSSLRHAEGITYGLSPSIFSLPELGLLSIEAAFEQAETARAIRDLQAALQALQDQGVSSQELELSKVSILAELERALHGNGSLARRLAADFAEGRSASFLATLPSQLAAITPADIQRVAKRYLRPKQLEIGVAGPSELAAEVERLGELEIYRVSRGTGSQPED